MAGIRGGGGVLTNVSLAKKSEVNDSVNSVTSIRLHKRWGVNTLQYSHPLTRPVTHLALSCNALYTRLTYISNYHNNRTLIIGEKKHKNPIREQIFSLFGYYGYVILSFLIRSARFCSQDSVSVGFLARKLKSL